MKYHTQTLLVKEHGHGNCYQVTLACLLDVEIYEIPDIALFFNLDICGNHWYNIIQSYLKQKFKVREISAKDLGDYHLNSAPFPEKFIDVPYMVTGISPRGINHVVVYMNGEMIHDVHPDKSGVAISGNSEFNILESTNN